MSKNLKESVYILSRLFEFNDRIMHVIADAELYLKKNQEGNLTNVDHYISLFNTILMNSVSYMQELENNFYLKSEDLYRERIKKILLIAKPATKKINSWKDLKHYRNDMIAHNLRIKNNSLALYQLGKYKAPRTWNDIILLHLYMKMIQNLIHFEFKEECKDLNSIIRSLEIANNPADYTNLKNEPPIVLDQINNLCKKHLKPYKLNKLSFHIE